MNWPEMGPPQHEYDKGSASKVRPKDERNIILLTIWLHVARLISGHKD